MFANLLFKRVYIRGYNVFIQGVDVRVIEDWILLNLFNKLRTRDVRVIEDWILLNLFNKLRTRDKMRGLSNVLSLFRNEFYYRSTNFRFY